jgi:hypothetical protein
MLKGPSSRAVFAGLTGLLTYLVGGMAIGHLSVGLLTVLVPAAIVVGAVPVAGAGLIAVLCFGAGLSAARGLEGGMLLVPLFLVCLMIAPPAWGAPVDRDTTSYLLWNMVIWGVGGLWAVLVFPPLLRKRMKPVHREPHSRARHDRLHPWSSPCCAP